MPASTRGRRALATLAVAQMTSGAAGSPASASPELGDASSSEPIVFNDNGGWSWKWTALTAESNADNIRPIVPIWDGRHIALLWLWGTCTPYWDYDLDVVGIVIRHDHDPAATDATPADLPQLARSERSTRLATPSRRWSRVW
jgi:hypothetical protein